jgi:hypothetical protein
MTEGIIIITAAEDDAITLPQLYKFMIQPREIDWYTDFGTAELRLASAASSELSE